jgi:hypothetical protein
LIAALREGKRASRKAPEMRAPLVGFGCNAFMRVTHGYRLLWTLGTVAGEFLAPIAPTGTETAE